MATKLTLNGGVALVTGAASGLGEEIAFAFAEAGVRGVVFADLNEPGAAASAEASRKYAKHAEYRAISVAVDVVDEGKVQNMVDVAIREFGRIEYNVNSAGLGNLSGDLTPEVKVDNFVKIMDVNVKGTMLCNQAVSKAMMKQEPLTYHGRHGVRELGRGSIVNMASAFSYVTVPGMLSYATSKHALTGLTKSVSIDNLKNNIRVNSVCPAWVDTPMMQEAVQRGATMAQLIKAVSPLRRMATTEEVADYVIFLCSPSAS